MVWHLTHYILVYNKLDNSNFFPTEPTKSILQNSAEEDLPQTT